MFDQLKSEGAYFVGKILNNAFEGIDYVFKVVVVKELKIDSEDIFEERLNQIFGSFMFKNAIESNSSFNPD